MTAAAASESERGKEEEEEGAQQTNRRKKGQQIKKGKLFFFFALVVASHYTAIMSFGMSVLSITFGVLCCLPPRPCRFHLFFFFSSLTQRQSLPSPFSSSPSNLNRRQCFTGRKEGRRKKINSRTSGIGSLHFQGATEG